MESQRILPGRSAFEIGAIDLLTAVAPITVMGLHYESLSYKVLVVVDVVALLPIPLQLFCIILIAGVLRRSKGKESPKANETRWVLRSHIALSAIVVAVFALLFLSVWLKRA